MAKQVKARYSHTEPMYERVVVPPPVGSGKVARVTKGKQIGSQDIMSDGSVAVTRRYR